MSSLWAMARSQVQNKKPVVKPEETIDFALDKTDSQTAWARARSKKPPQTSQKVEPIVKPQASVKEPSLLSKAGSFVGSGLKKFTATSDAFLDPFQDAFTLGGSKLVRKGLDRVGLNQTEQVKESARGEISPTTQKVANVAGTIAGYAQPTKLAYKTIGKLGTAGLKKVAPKAGKLVTEGVRGASAGAGVGAFEGVLSGRDAKGIAESTAIGAVGGAILDPAAVKAGELLSPLAKRLTKGMSKGEVTPKELPKTESVPKTPEVYTAKDTVKPITETPAGPLIAGSKERQFAQNVRESNVATQEIKENLNSNRLTYEPITNKETFNKAAEVVEKDPEAAKNLFSSPGGGVTADDVALGEALITKAIKDGNTSEANRLIADLAEKLTTAGQAVQAASIFKRLTPEGMLLYAQRTVNNIKKELLQRMGLKAPKVELTEQDSQFILDTMRKAQLLPDGREKDIELGKVMQLIANKSPASNSEKAQGLQRIAMLLNPKTMVRNTLGNVIFGTIDNVSNAVATPIDMLTSKFTGKRTTTLPSLKGQFKSGLEGVKETIQDARMGIDTYGVKTQYELPNKRIFKTDALNKLDIVTRTGLQLGDRPFYKAAYEDALRQQIKASKATKPTQEMIEQAHMVAQQRTYQDTNALVDAFKKVQNALNKVSSYVGLGTEQFGLGNIVLPFTKTPANILARAIEYSPLGVQKAIKEAIKYGKGTFNQKTFVDAIARSVTGTALIMVGYDLAKDGTITGSANKDKDVAAFERDLGKSDFAFKVGDKYYTYDWAQPASMAIAVGADMYLKGKDRKEAENVVVDAIKSGGETLFKQSLLQGVERFMGGYNFMDNLETTTINAPTQFVPTLSKQITQLTDPYRRNVYSPNKLGTGLNLIKSKVPGLSKTLEPKLDTFGKPIMNYQGNNSIFNIFVNPGFATEFKPNKTQKEIIRVYEETGNKDIFPKLSPRSLVYKGQQYKLTPKEITAFQKTMGEETERRFGALMNDERYSGLPEEQKAKMLAKQIDEAYENAKKQFLGSRLK